MGRPPLSVGTYGKIGFTVAVGPPQRVRARAHFRDFDGVVRQVTKFGASKAAAERALKLALRDRVAPGRSDITAETTVEVLARRWLEDLPADRSTNTRQAYGYVVTNFVIPVVGALRTSPETCARSSTASDAPCATSAAGSPHPTVHTTGATPGRSRG